MQRHTSILFMIICIAALLTAGCTGPTDSPAPVSTPVPAIITTTAPVPVPTTAPPTAVPATTATVLTIAATPVPTAVVTTVQAAADPILHRYIRQSKDLATQQVSGYEFRFFSDGTLLYREGTTKEVSSNLMIKDVSLEASGTWTSLGNNKYLVKFLPTGVSGAQTVREYILVPAHEDKAYPGIIFREHIESSYETNAINPGQQKTADTMYYPERAKID